MSAEYHLLKTGLIAREQSYFGATLAWSNKTAPCSMGTTGFGGRLTTGGISPGTEVKVTVRKEVLNCELKVGKAFKLTDSQGVQLALKIARDGIRDCIFAWEIDFVDENQNA